MSETELLLLKKVMELALAMEAADKNVKEFQSTENTHQASEQTQPTSKIKKPCYRCGRQDHNTSD